MPQLGKERKPRLPKHIIDSLGCKWCCKMSSQLPLTATAKQATYRCPVQILSAMQSETFQWCKHSCDLGKSNAFQVQMM